MFSFHGGTSNSVDLDEPRKAPPLPTKVVFPQEEIKVQQSETWAKNPPDLFQEYSTPQKPSDIRIRHIEDVNVAIYYGVPLEEFIPQSKDAYPHLPPEKWIRNLELNAHTSSGPHKTEPSTFKLSNGAKAPTAQLFAKYAQELACSTHDGLREIGRKKPMKGHTAPSLNHYREFWTQLETVSKYWNDSKDHYFESDESRPSSSSSAKGSRRMSLFSSGSAPADNKQKRRSITSLFSKRSNQDQRRKSLPNIPVSQPNQSPPSADTNGTAASPSSPKQSSEPGPEAEAEGQAKDQATEKRLYKGYRVSNGAAMSENVRIDLLKAFIKPVVYSFHCSTVVPTKTPRLEIQALLIPVTQTAVIYRQPENKDKVKRGILEGPVLAMQCRKELDFLKNDNNNATVDVAREIACLMLLAQERAREGKVKRVAGAGKWYTKPRWGGGPGGEFGEAENTDQQQPAKRMTSVSGGLPRRMTEEEIWKRLEPNSSLWNPRVSYIAVGKDVTSRADSVFMISSLFHHVSFLRMDIDPVHLDFITFKTALPEETTRNGWHKPQIYRTKWYNLLDADDRVEAFRGLWGLISFQMRAAHTSLPDFQRKVSDINNGLPSHRTDVPTANLHPQRSHSVAF